MNIKENMKITPIVMNHWKFKFERAICILLKGGYKSEDLIMKIKEKSLEYEKKN